MIREGTNFKEVRLEVRQPSRRNGSRSSALRRELRSTAAVDGSFCVCGRLDPEMGVTGRSPAGGQRSNNKPQPPSKAERRPSTVGRKVGGRRLSSTERAQTADSAVSAVGRRWRDSMNAPSKPSEKKVFDVAESELRPHTSPAGPHKGASIVLQLECLAIDCVRKSIHPTRT